MTLPDELQKRADQLTDAGIMADANLMARAAKRIDELLALENRQSEFHDARKLLAEVLRIAKGEPK